VAEGQVALITLRVTAEGTTVISQTGAALEALGTQAQGATDKASQGVTQFGQAQQQAFAGLNQNLAESTSGVVGLGTALKNIGQIALGINLANAVQAAVGAFKDLVAEGLRYNSSIEQSKLGIASIITSTQQIVTGQGAILQGAEKFAAAQKLSSDLMKQIQKDALLTTATAEQLTQAFQQGVGPLSAAGLNLNQARDATLKIVQAASALGIPMNQVAQEVRAIAEGSIDVNARLARTLGITNAQVAAQKEQGTLYQFIVEQTNAFALAGEATAKSFAGLASSLQDISSQILGKAFAEPFEELKTAMSGVLSVLLDVNDALDKTDDLATAAGVPLTHVAENRQPGFAGQLLPDIGAASLETLKFFIGFLDDAYNKIKTLIAILPDLAKILVDTFIMPAQGVLGFIGNLVLGKSAMEDFNKSATNTANEFLASFEHIGVQLDIIKDKTLAIEPGFEQIRAAGRTSFKEISDATFLANSAYVQVTLALDDYVTSANAAAVANDNLAKSQAKARDSVKDQIDKLTLQINTFEQARAQGQSYEEAIKSVDKAVAAANTNSADLGNQLVNLGTKWDGLTEAEKASQAALKERERTQEQAEKTAQREAEALQKKTADIQKEIALNEAIVAVNKQVLAGEISHAQGLEKIAGLTAAAKAGETGLGQAYAKSAEDLKKSNIEVKNREEALKKAAAAAQAASEKEQDSIRKHQEEQDKLVLGYENEIKANEENVAIITAGIAAGQSAVQITDALTLAKIRQKLASDGLTDGLEAEAQALFASGKAADKAAADFDKYQQSVNDALLTTGDIKDTLDEAIKGLASGTLNVGELLQRQGQAIGGKLIEGVIFGKSQGEKPLIDNFNGLVGGQGGGILGGILGEGGLNIGKLFGGNAADAATTAWTEGQSDIFTADPAGIASAGTSFGTIFGGVAATAAGTALGSGLSSMLGGKGGGLGSSLGGIAGGIGGFLIGGPLGAGIGSALGSALGGIIEGLFAHTPTKGTQIRKGVIDTLKEVDVAFADQLNSKTYGFEWTKEYMKKTGESFLEASQHFIPENFPEVVAKELDKQLLAVGALVTQEQASKLGKPLAQTATTFANLITANLKDPGDISKFLDSTVEKMHITLESLITALNSSVESGALSVDMYKNAVEGAVSLFSKDLPEAMNVAKLEADSFGTDGVFSLETFNKKVEESAARVSAFGQAVGDAFTTGIEQGLDPAQVGAAFEKTFKEGIAQAFVAQQVADTIKQASAGIDFSKPFDPNDPALEKAKQLIETNYSNTVSWLRAAGLLPDAFNDTADAVDKVTEAEKDASKEAEKLAGIISGNVENAVNDALKVVREYKTKRDALLADKDKPLKEKAQALADLGPSPELGEQIRTNIADSVTQGLQDAFIQGAITDAILTPFKERLTAYTKEALSDGFLSPEELAHIGQLGKDAASAAGQAAEAIGPAFAQADEVGKSIKGDAAITADSFQGITLQPVVVQSDQIRTNMEAAAAAAGSTSLGQGGGGALHFASGGEVQGPSGTDVIPAMLTAGEFVVPADVAKKYLPFLRLLQHGVNLSAGSIGGIKGYAAGGLVDSKYAQDALSNLGIGVEAESLASITNAISYLTSALAQLPELLKSQQAFQAQLKAAFESGQITGNQYINQSNVGGNTTMAAGVIAPRALPYLQDLLEKALDSIMDPVNQFLDQAPDQIKALNDQFTELAQTLIDNRAALEAAGVDVGAKLNDLATALRSKVGKAVDDLLAPVREFAKIPTDHVQDVADEFARLNKLLEDNRPTLEAAGQNVDALLAQLAAALPARLAEAAAQATDSAAAGVAKSFRDAIDKFTSGPESRMGGAERVAALQGQFALASQLAQGGDQEQAAKALDLGQQLIEASRQAYASSQITADIEKQVLDTFDKLATTFGAPGPGGVGVPIDTKAYSQAIIDGVKQGLADVTIGGTTIHLTVVTPGGDVLTQQVIDTINTNAANANPVLSPGAVSPAPVSPGGGAVSSGAWGQRGPGGGSQWVRT
jgi:hypothetical protein